MALFGVRKGDFDFFGKFLSSQRGYPGNSHFFKYLVKVCPNMVANQQSASCFAWKFLTSFVVASSRDGGGYGDLKLWSKQSACASLGRFHYCQWGTSRVLRLANPGSEDPFGASEKISSYFC